MKKNNSKSGLNIVFLIIGLIILISIVSATVFYFYRFRKSENSVVSGVLVKNLNYPTGDIYWVPFWVGNSISEGDKEFSPVGFKNAEIVKKEL